MFDAYAEQVSRPGGPLDGDTIRVYLSRVRQYLAWLAGALESGAVDGDPLTGRPPGTGPCATTAPTCSPWPGASPPRSTRT